MGLLISVLPVPVTVKRNPPFTIESPEDLRNINVEPLLEPIVDAPVNVTSPEIVLVPLELLIAPVEPAPIIEKLFGVVMLPDN
jgi:hypothetical protein